MPQPDLVLLGHTGFIGKALADEVRRRGLQARGYSSAELDLRRPEALRTLETGPDSVLIAASALTLDRADDTPELFEANMAMVANLARRLESRPPARCVYLSSFTVYAGTASQATTDEDSPVAPATYYAASKYAGELLLAAAARRADFPLLTLRLGRVYGPGLRRAVYGPVRFIQSILERGELELYGDGRESRDHLYIDDAARIIADLALGSFEGVYNVVCGSSRSFQDVVSSLRAVAPPFRVLERPRMRPVVELAPFSTAKLYRALPGARFTPFEEGLGRTYRQMASAHA